MRALALLLLLLPAADAACNGGVDGGLDLAR